MLRHKRAQEEMVGFVLIILVVAVIFLVILGIYARKPGDIEPRTSGEIYYFLESVMETTSPCALGYVPNYIKISDLLEKCLEDIENRGNTECISGEKVCDVANTTLMQILDESWSVGPKHSVKGYIFESKIKSSSGKGISFKFNKGLCGFRRMGAEYSLVGIDHLFTICS